QGERAVDAGELQVWGKDAEGPELLAEAEQAVEVEEAGGPLRAGAGLTLVFDRELSGHQVLVARIQHHVGQSRILPGNLVRGDRDARQIRGQQHTAGET